MMYNSYIVPISKNPSPVQYYVYNNNIAHLHTTLHTDK